MIGTRNLFLISMFIIILSGCTETIITGTAVGIIKDKLKSPSTAKFSTSDIVIREDRTAIVTVDYEAKNAFGVLLRSQACVCVDLDKGGAVLEEAACSQQRGPANDLMSLCKSMAGKNK